MEDASKISGNGIAGIIGSALNAVGSVVSSSINASSTSKQLKSQSEIAKMNYELAKEREKNSGKLTTFQKTLIIIIVALIIIIGMVLTFKQRNQCSLK